jgi:hypothetical protein
MRQFKLSNDPQLATNVRDIVGLYVDPPTHAVVLSVDEKSQIQALDRTRPRHGVRHRSTAGIARRYQVSDFDHYRLWRRSPGGFPDACESFDDSSSKQGDRHRKLTFPPTYQGRNLTGDRSRLRIRDRAANAYCIAGYRKCRLFLQGFRSSIMSSKSAVCSKGRLPPGYWMPVLRIPQPLR